MLKFLLIQLPIAHLQEETTNDATLEITNTKFYVGSHFVYI